MKALFIPLIAIALLSCMHTSRSSLVADSGFAASALKQCKSDLRYLNQVSGWQGAWPAQWKSVIAAGPDLANKSVAQWLPATKALALAINKLRIGIERKETAPRAVVLRVYQQIHQLGIELTAKNSKYIFRYADHNNAVAWNTLIRTRIAPAVIDFEKFLYNEYLPMARQSVGLIDITNGAKCFTNAVTWWTA